MPTWTESRTLDPLAERDLSRSGGSQHRSASLQLLFHPDLRRVGDCTSDPLFGSHAPVPVGRDYPTFSGAQQAPRPLADPCISRQQLQIVRVALDGFIVKAEAGARREVSLSALDGTAHQLGECVPAGTVITLGDRVMLLIRLQGPTTALSAPTQLLGRSEPMEELRAAIVRAATSESNVLVYGESGVGKELVARAIHDSSTRAQEPYVAVNCAALTETLLESELFGHVRGAFTGADVTREGLLSSARGGTLFLDEVGELPLATQAKLLRILQERTFTPVGSSRPELMRARVIAATNRKLVDSVRAQTFREDLYYRLATLVVTVPPLRERRADVPELFTHFLGELARKHEPLRRHFRAASQLQPTIPLSFVQRLMRFSWPGNVRQLRSVVERVALANLARGAFRISSEVTTELGEPGHAPELPAAAANRFVRETGPADAAGLLELLERHDFSPLRAARELGVSHSTIDRWMREHGIARPKDLEPEEIKRSAQTHGNDVAAMARSLRVSRRGLSLRMQELGLFRRPLDP